MTRTIFAAALAVLITFAFVAPAQAGPYGDDLSKCLIKSTTPEDKNLLVEWIFFAIALNPTVAPMTNIPQAKRDEINKGTAKMFERLLTDTCLTETQEAVKYEGQGAVSEAFKLLGQVASQEMFSSPAVAAGTAAFTKYLDSDRLDKVFGIKPKSEP
jgi:hypothetical protein